MTWKQFAREYLAYTKKERIGILVLTGLILLVFLLPSVIRSSGHLSPDRGDSLWISRAIALESGNEGEDPDSDQNRRSFVYDRPASSTHIVLFDFDPNSLDDEGWIKLGLRDRTIRTIRNYLEKGGRFRKAEDLGRIYGLREDEFNRLKPYIRIAGSPASQEAGPVNEPTQRTYPVPKAIDINIADTSAWISLPGIGNRLASRIVNFREKLGGFHSVEQVGETYGLKDSVFRKLKPLLLVGDAALRKININAADADELKAHPYISHALAGAIVSYRGEHGAFSAVADLKKLMAISEEVYIKISPYLTTQ